jgi:hypothetical protein
MIRIAMISGPRNLSTAMMRSFGSRPDCQVVDEPLYAAYLARTGLRHPAREAILASQSTDYQSALGALAGAEGEAALQYEKHMAHHLAPEDDLAWLRDCRVALLLRDPRAVIASYARVREQPTPEDVGFPQQLAVLEHLRARGREPVVVRADRILADPTTVLAGLCEALEIPWTEAMLAWEPGLRTTDGVWAPHWYASVIASTGFGPPRSASTEVPAELAPVVEACMPAWEALAPLAL